MYIIDAHQDLAWNMRTFSRDYTRAAAETWQVERELGSVAPAQNGDTLLGWPDYQRGRVAVVFATLFAAPARRKLGPWDTQFYQDTGQARTRYLAQLDDYHRLVDDYPDKFRLIQTQDDLQNILEPWKQARVEEESEEDHNADEDGEEHPPDLPVGLVILMEGAEAVQEPAELEEWWGKGVRVIGPAWAGTRFCGGTGEPGPLTPEGYGLLEVMADLGFSLDLSHMDEQATLQALDHYPGAIIASHANAGALLKGAKTNRHLSDRVIHGILERDGVIGVVLYNKFLQEGWRPLHERDKVTLHDVVAHIDYICQIAGDARHVGIGSDFDGGFGWQSVPMEIDTIADLHKIVPLLVEKGYSKTDIATIMGQNWRVHLEKTLPESV